MFSKIKKAFNLNTCKIDENFILHSFNLIEYYKDINTFMAIFLYIKNESISLSIFIQMYTLTLEIENTTFRYSIFNNSYNKFADNVKYINLKGVNNDEKFESLFQKINNDISQIILDKQFFEI